MCRDARVGAARRGFVVVLVALVVSLTGGAARAESFTEDFSSLAYCDTAQTTACWDTASGTLRLYPYAPRVEASLPIDEGAYCCLRVGDRVFVGQIDVGIRSVDISDIHSPAVAAGFLPVEFPLDIAADGDRLIVAAHDRVLVVDASDPDRLTLLGQTAAVTEVNTVALAGSVAWLTSCAGGLYAVDIADPTAPALISQTPTVSCAEHLALGGDYAYVCTGYFGFSVFDISDPAAPVQVAQVPAAYEPRSLRIAGGLAFVAESSGELLIYSLADPAAPALLGACALPGDAQDVAVDGRFAYVTVGDPELSAFAVVDAADPAAPRLLGSSALPGFPMQVERFGEYALVNSVAALLVLRIADPLAPSVAGAMPANPGIEEFAVDGNCLYALGHLAGDEAFLTLSLADPQQPALLGHCELPAPALGLAAAPPRVYLPLFGSGLAVVDVADPAAPVLLATPALDCTGVAAQPCGDLLYLGYVSGAHPAGLLSLDVSDPAQPQVLCDLPLAYSPRELCRHGDWLYALQWEDGEKTGDRGERQSAVGIIDVSDPRAPFLAATLAVKAAYVEFLRIDGDLLYASFWSFEGMYGHGVLIYDISEPCAPRLLSRFEGAGGFGQLALAGDLAFLSGDQQIDVLDVSDPEAPRHLHSLLTPRRNLWLGVAGDYLYSASGYFGLQALRVYDRSVDQRRCRAQSSPLPAPETPPTHVRMQAAATPSVLWEFSADGGAHWQVLAAPGQWLPIAEPGEALLWRARLLYTEIGAPPVVDALTLEWTAAATAAGDAAPPAFALAPPAPNPFNPHTTLRFSLPAAGQVQLSVLDANGRAVRLLLDAVLPAGPHERVWDGRSDAGEALPSGIYLCRLTAPGAAAAQKLVLIR